VAATANVTMGYDVAGNRTSMTDGLGSVSYVYNTLSQLTSEARTFTGLSPKTISYSYNLAGELTSITNPWGAQVGYTYDKIGRPTQVTGTGYAGNTDYVNNIAYRAFGMRQMANANGKTLSLQYDNRMRVTRWDVPGVMGWAYAYATPLIQENTGRVAFADNLYDPTLDRSYHYDQVGRLVASHTGKEGRGHAGYEAWGAPDGPYAENYSYDQFGNMTWRNGWGAVNAQYVNNPQFANNRMTVNPVTGAGMSYDLAGNLTNDGSQSFSFDATGQQTYASATGLTQNYDGDRLRVKKVESGATTYYLRSAVLGGQVIAELNSSGGWIRGYVYLGGQMVALQGGTGGQVSWVHQDPVTKSQRITNSSGAVVSTVDLDPWGGETGRSSNQAFQPHRYTTYERDANGGDDAMMRRYQVNWSRFAQPDPYDGAYNMTDPQSFNRYAYLQNDPVNFVDPSGLMMMICGYRGGGDGFSIIQCDYFSDASYRFGGYNSERPLGGGDPGDPPQEPAKPSHSPDTRTDCERFADRVAQIAAGHDEVGNFVDELARNFIGVSSSDADVMRQRANTSTGEYFSSDGFRIGLFDQVRDNQARHFIGGLIAGYNLGGRIGTAVMNYNEDSQADRNVNRSSVPLGANLRNPRGASVTRTRARDDIRDTTTPANPGFKALAKMIRKLVCR